MTKTRSGRSGSAQAAQTDQGFEPARARGLRDLNPPARRVRTPGPLRPDLVFVITFRKLSSGLKNGLERRKFQSQLKQDEDIAASSSSKAVYPTRYEKHSEARGGKSDAKEKKKKRCHGSNACQTKDSKATRRRIHGG